MRLIAILLALAALGWLAAERLRQGPETGPAPDESTPRVPEHPQQVPQFEQDMNRFMQEQGDQRREQVESSGG